jgi:hypothetical protein
MRVGPGKFLIVTGIILLGSAILYTRKPIPRVPPKPNHN